MIMKKNTLFFLQKLERQTSLTLLLLILISIVNWKLIPISNINTFFYILLCGTSKHQITAENAFKKPMPKKMLRRSPEDMLKPFLTNVFRGYKIRTLPRNG